jgi:hypothetical protein
MKKVLGAFLIVVVYAYNVPLHKQTAEMPGAYKMISQSFAVGKNDTPILTRKQLKIFTPDFMMYANINVHGTDTVSAFGVGSYTATGNKVKETTIYGAADTNVNTRNSSYNLEITKMPKGFKQYIAEIDTVGGEKVSLTEVYEKIGTSKTTPLDGVWKITKYQRITGNDTTTENVNQYKAYYAGHFIWGNASLDSTSKSHTGIGYGSFVMNGNNKSKETIFESTFAELKGLTVDIDIKMNGNDQYQQTIINGAVTTIETYNKLKK